MQEPSQVCGNCGRPVVSGDVTCPHCGVLLAAYASPTGSTSPHMYESSAPIADAVPQAEMYVPAPAPPIEIPDEVEVASTAPRPLFDTQLTVEEIAKAAEGDHDESLVVVNETKVVTKPKVFDTPDYARPPSDAAPVQVLDGGDEDLIARAPEEAEPKVPEKATGQPATPPSTAPIGQRGDKARPQQPERDEPAEIIPPAGKPDIRPSYSVAPLKRTAPGGEPESNPEAPKESWLYDLSQSGPANMPTRPRRERTNRPEPVRTTTQPPVKRGRTDAYLKKLHAETGYVPKTVDVSKPVEMPDRELTQAKKDNRQGCAGILYLSTAIIWLIAIGSLLGGAPSGFFIFLAMVMFVVIQQKNKIFNFMENL